MCPWNLAQANAAAKPPEIMARVTVTVRPKGNKQVAVRASIEHNDKTVDDPQNVPGLLFRLVEVTVSQRESGRLKQPDLEF